MSILGAEEVLDTAGKIILFGGLPLSVLILWVGGVFKKKSVDGPERILANQRSIGPVIVTIVGLIAWFGLQMAYGTYLQILKYRSGSSEALDVAKDLTPRDFAFLTIFPPILGLICLFVGDLLTSPTMPARLGYSPGRLPRGIITGAIGIVAIFPLVMLTMLGFQLFYNAIGFEHPSEHELLRVLNEASPELKRVLIFGATILVPIFEEIFFRGHMQSVLKRWMGRAWPAILITSLIFSVLHPLWTAPAIFTLAIGLGYLYERTGNLWAPIFAHIFFNSFETWYYLTLMRPH